jgi:NAD(P)-dependent dehydrogenase (short-subunit alcohol dehydrogenase family)
VFSLVALTREPLPLLKKSEAGRIVNLASILGSLTLQAKEPSPIALLRKFAYDASKAAVNVFTIHLAAELKDTNIKVNSVHRGLPDRGTLIGFSTTIWFALPVEHPNDLSASRSVCYGACTDIAEAGSVGAIGQGRGRLCIGGRRIVHFSTIENIEELCP